MKKVLSDNFRLVFSIIVIGLLLGTLTVIATPELPSYDETETMFKGRILIHLNEAIQTSDLETPLHDDTWYDIPGVEMEINLPITMHVNLRAFGVVDDSGGQNAGFRFLIDDVPYGNPLYGDRFVSIIGKPAQWYMERTEYLPKGTHTIRVQLRNNAQLGRILQYVNEGFAAKLVAEAWR